MNTEKLPAIIAIVAHHDSGEFGNATCPHCGAQGRYVSTFICDDGSVRGAMAGCIQRFPQSPLARLTGEAHDRARKAAQEGARLAGWWAEINDATAALAGGRIAVAEFEAAVRSAEWRRQDWLRRKGYGRRRR